MVIFSSFPFSVCEVKQKKEQILLLMSILKVAFVEIDVPELWYERMKFTYCQPDPNMRQI